MDTNFAISAIRSIKCYNPTYILADKAYDTELIKKKTIVEETTTLPQNTCENKTKKVEHTSQNLEQYSEHKYTDSETLVEGVNSLEKRKFSRINNSQSTTLQNKGNKT